MFNISSFLDKISKSIKNYSDYNERVIEIVLKETKIKLENIEIKEDIIYFQGNPSIKNKIFISKNNLIEAIRRETGLNIRDIK